MRAHLHVTSVTSVKQLQDCVEGLHGIKHAMLLLGGKQASPPPVRHTHTHTQGAVAAFTSQVFVCVPFISFPAQVVDEAGGDILYEVCGEGAACHTILLLV